MARSMRKVGIPNDQLRKLQVQAIVDYLWFKYRKPRNPSPRGLPTGEADSAGVRIPKRFLEAIEVDLDDFLCLRHQENLDRIRKVEQEDFW